MKVLVFVKATPNSEQGIKPDQDLSKLFADMGKFNDKLVKAGVLKEADGLKPSSFGKRLKFSDDGFTALIDGPFAETKELVAGYWIWDVESIEEAVEWAKQCPNPMPGEEGVIEIRPAYTLEDFGDLVGEQAFQEEKRQRSQLARAQEAGVKGGRQSRSAKTKTKTKSGANPRAKRRPTPRARSKK